jgi:hypothetical protein
MDRQPAALPFDHDPKARQEEQTDQPGGFASFFD